ncbi:hypothetical protein MUP01_00070, partial [Candidatus Bathyarchaeota archaeon]|nr:hypothetical protein [Candidatus Bathyarchaeota archaeon]
CGCLKENLGWFSFHRVHSVGFNGKAEFERGGNRQQTAEVEYQAASTHGLHGSDRGSKTRHHYCCRVL